MAPLARTSQAIFKINDIARLAERTPEQADRLYRRYSTRRSTFTRDIDVDAVLGSLIIAAGESIGMPLDTVALHVVPLVNHALFYLGSESMPWPISGNSARDVPVLKLISEAEGFSRDRRIQELLNIQERPTARYLIWKGGMDTLLTDDLNGLVADASEPSFAVVDARAIANALRKYRSDPLFWLELSAGE